MAQLTYIRSSSSPVSHIQVREVPGRFGVRHVGLCGVSLYRLSRLAGAQVCVRCVAKAGVNQKESE